MGVAYKDLHKPWCPWTSPLPQSPWTAVDGGFLVYQGCLSHPALGGIERDSFEHFFQSLCGKAGLNAHIIFHGRNDHHQMEAVFKAFGIALHDAVSIVAGREDIPSTKGIL